MGDPAVRAAGAAGGVTSRPGSPSRRGWLSRAGAAARSEDGHVDDDRLTATAPLITARPVMSTVEAGATVIVARRLPAPSESCICARRHRGRGRGGEGRPAGVLQLDLRRELNLAEFKSTIAGNWVVPPNGSMKGGPKIVDPAGPIGPVAPVGPVAPLGPVAPDVPLVPACRWSQACRWSPRSPARR